MQIQTNKPAFESSRNLHYCHWVNCLTMLQDSECLCVFHALKIPAKLKLDLKEHYKSESDAVNHPTSECAQALKEVVEWSAYKEGDLTSPAAQKLSSSGHYCHWPGCEKSVPPRLWGCSSHWFKLPIHLRSKILRTYVAGQEITKTPSRAYIDAALEVQKWINENGK